MTRVFVLVLALVSLLPAAAAAPPDVDVADPCGSLGAVCDLPRPIAVVGPDRVCGGVGFQYGGTAACVFPQEGCVRTYWGTAYGEQCPGDVLGPVVVADPCDRLGAFCDVPRPIVVVNPERVCGGVGFQYGGTAACVFPQEGCVRTYWGTAYGEQCPGKVVGTLVSLS